MVCPWNGILHSKKREWIVDTCYNKNESQNYYVEWKMPEKRIHAIWFHWYEILEKEN